jgi:hypothetical protein
MSEEKDGKATLGGMGTAGLVEQALIDTLIRELKRSPGLMQWLGKNGRTRDDGRSETAAEHLASLRALFQDELAALLRDVAVENKIVAELIYLLLHLVLARAYAVKDKDVYTEMSIIFRKAQS